MCDRRERNTAIKKIALEQRQAVSRDMHEERERERRNRKFQTYTHTHT
jgi:hypothetical protein